MRQDQRLEALKDQFAKKAALKTPKRIIDKQATVDDEEGIDIVKIQKMVEDERKAKEGLRMQIMSNMMKVIVENSEFESRRLDSFKAFTKYKYPILSPKRSSLEREAAGIMDFPNTPTKIITKWEPGMLSKMRADSRTSSPARTSKNRSGLGRTQTIPSKQGAKELALFTQD